MSIAELVPRWPGLPEAAGPLLEGPSLRGRSYRMRIDVPVDLRADGILAARGIVGDLEPFLDPQLRRDMPDPDVLLDMVPAANRIAAAVRRRERVVVFGDYDVDGAASSAVIGRWFAGLGMDVAVYIPDRMSEGYGPNALSVGRALSSGADLLICVDCGTSSVDVLESVDCDVVVIDHHKQQGELPAVTAVVNPHRVDDRSGLGMLCATSIAFLVVVAAQRVLREAGDLPADAPPVRDLLDIVALATVADVVPLIGPSRLFVAKGLEVMASRPSPGIAALMTVAGIDDVSSGRIGFALGPRINAGGRVGSGSSSSEGALGVRLLMARTVDEAMPIAQRLDAMNRERQEVEKSCLEEAMAQAQIQFDRGDRIICVFGKGWHPGVVGIVAGRVRERFDVPAMVGALSDGVIKGSGRSVQGFDLGELVVEARRRGLLESGGGHAMACGFGCRLDGWQDFVEFLSRRARWETVPLAIDCLVDGADVSMADVDSLSRLDPVGQGNPSVKAAIAGLRVTGVQQLKNGHVKLSLRHGGGEIQGLWWRARDEGFEDILLGMTDVEVVAIGSPRVDEWNNVRRVSMELVDLVPVA